jgi:hypothetical protein
VTIEDLERDDEYYGLMLRLTQSLAEQVRQEHEDLIAHGFAVVEVIGSPALLYRRGGKAYTREFALAKIEKEEGS